MDIFDEKPLHQRLASTQSAAKIAGIVFVISAIFSFIVAVFFILESTKKEFLYGFYIFMAIFFFTITAVIIIPGLMFLKFGQNKIASQHGGIINYHFKTLRNVFIILCLIFGIAGIIIFTSGGFILLEEIMRYLRQY
jgi:bacteriorhodopsin